MTKNTQDPANTDMIVLVNEAGEPIGTALKLESHHAETPLHLAFSVYIFNSDGRVLATQRAHSKKVWPGVWTNSCCGHPAPLEAMHDAIKRRVAYELGMSITNVRTILPDYRYKTPAFDGVIEHEVCPVFFATSNDEPEPNSLEVEAYKWLTWDELLALTASDESDTWSWWSKDQLKQLAIIKT